MKLVYHCNKGERLRDRHPFSDPIRKLSTQARILSPMASDHPPTELVFVYGTLRREGSNHWRMQHALFQSTATAQGKLYRIDWYPGAKFDPESPQIILGELYLLYPTHLHELDAFEGPEYERIPIEIQTPATSIQAWAYHYLPDITTSSFIPTGDWLTNSHNP
jgi:gamma-glutamylcyclotransferase (GGCT)/AIG2-like uncharacterized protein YtfP